MPLLFALGLRSVQSHLSEDEHLLAFHDDIHIVSQLERTCELYGILARELWVHSHIRIDGGETQIWNRGRFHPPQATMPCLQSPVRMSRMPRFGLVITLHLSLNTVFVFWALLWAAMHSSGPNSKPLENPMSLLSRVRRSGPPICVAAPSLLCSNPCHVLFTGVSSRAFRPSCPPA